MNFDLKLKFMWMPLIFVSLASADLLPNPGPRSATEADFLFQEAQNSQSSGDYEPAIRSLERFRARYPNDSRFLDSSLQLLKANFLLHRDTEVLRLAKEALHQKVTKDQELEVKNFLASSYLNLHHYPEAQITAQELLKESSKASMPDANKAQALLITFKIDVAQNKLSQATEAYDALKTLSEKSKVTLEPHSMLPHLGALLKILKCEDRSAVIPSKDDEENWMKIYSAQNLCLKEISASLQSAQMKDTKDTWCEHHRKLQAEVSHSTLEKFAKNKIKSELDSAYRLGNCHDSTSH